MKTLSKADKFSSAFVLEDSKLRLKTGVTLGGEALAIQLPKALSKGTDYAIVGKGGKLVAVPAPFGAVDPFAESVGGFHAGLDGEVVPASLWDTEFRPAAPDPRGMVLVADLFWADIYLTGIDGNSRAGSVIADGGNPPMLAPGIPAANFNFWTARDLLASRGKQLLSAAEFALAADGVEDSKSAGRDPKKTGHIKGLRSTLGLEQATGCMWTWSRDLRPWGGIRLLGGVWGPSVSGPRQLYDGGAYGSSDLIGARGRCDHLILA